MTRGTSFGRVEHRRVGRALLMTLAAGTCFTMLSVQASAGPKGERVVRGNVQIDRNGAETVIRASNKAIINYESFSIRPGESVQFIQPGAKSRVLNRVTGSEVSRIDGSLVANGRVYLVNPAGVVFGPNSVVSAAGFIAAAGNLSDRDFLAGVDRFTSLTGPISAQGLITADAVHLIGERVANAGTIVADGGVVTMLAGGDVMLREKGSTIMVRVDGREADPARGPSAGRDAGAEGVGVDNSGSIRTRAGSVTLGAGDAYSLAIRNTGSVTAPGGAVTLSAGDGAVRNEGTLSASVERGRAGRVTVQGATVENRGVVSADAAQGAAGRVEVTSVRGTTLRAGSSVTARGGDGVASGGEALVHAYHGDTVVERGAVVDVSGGTMGGDGGFAEVSAARRLAVEGELRGESLAEYRAATLLLDPMDIIIASFGSQDGEIGDGQALASEDPGATWYISPAAIEGFAGNVRLEATQDIFVTESINKANGGLTLDAGRDISFSTDKGTLLPTLSVTAQFIDFRAGRNIVDRAITRTNLTSTVGNITLEATTGDIRTGRLAVPAGRSVTLTQAKSRYIGTGPTGQFTNPETTNLTVNITDGFLIFGGDFGGVSGSGSLLSVDAQAWDYLRIEDDLTIGTFASFRSFADVQVDGFVHAGGPVSFHGALDGIGGGGDGSIGVRFLSPGLSIWGSQISFRAGDGAGGANGAKANIVGNLPTFAGAGGPGTSPTLFSLRQDAPIGDFDLASAGQFGGGLNGLRYLLTSDASGVTVSTPAKVAGSHLELSGATGATIEADLGLASLLIHSMAQLNGDVTSSGDQTYQGPVVLGADLTLSGAVITFADAVDSTPTARSLTLNGDGVTLQQAVGANQPLAALLVNAPLTLNGGLVRTTGDQRYAGAVTLGDHTTLRSTGDGVIRFGSTVDGGVDLTVRTGEAGLIVFAADVGGLAALRDLTLLTSGDDLDRPVAKAATIVGEGSLQFDARDFRMGQNEKFTTLGALTINASRRATLGDLVTTSDMTVTAPDITLLLRPAAELIRADGTIIMDDGLDFVSGGTMTFNGTVSLAGLAGSPDPRFGAVVGAGSGSAPGGFDLLTVEVAEVTEQALMFEGVVLDQRVARRDTPPEPPDDDDRDGVSDALARAVPELPPLEIPVNPEAYDLALLSRVAVLGRPVSESEALSALSGRALYVDLPASLESFDEERTTAGTRVDPAAANRAARTFNAIFGEPGEERFAEVGSAIAASLERHLSLEQAASADPESFRRYLAGTEGEQATRAYVDGLGELMGQLRALGLTEVEFREAQRRILSAIVVPGGPSVEMLAEILDAAPGEAADAQVNAGTRTAEPRG